MFASAIFLMGMWERAAREFIGLAGTIRRIGGFRMHGFNTVGDTVTVRGKVAAKRLEGKTGVVELQMWSENGAGISVGPGTVTVTLPRRATS
jgi:acyl dehydratase